MKQVWNCTVHSFIEIDLERKLKEKSKKFSNESRNLYIIKLIFESLKSAIGAIWVGEGTHKMAAVVHAGFPGEEPASILGGGSPCLAR